MMNILSNDILLLFSSVRVGLASSPSPTEEAALQAVTYTLHNDASLAERAIVPAVSRM